MHDPTHLPPDIPVPLDDGAARLPPDKNAEEVVVWLRGS